MGLFTRSSKRQDSQNGPDNDSSSSENKKEKGGWKRPASKPATTFITTPGVDDHQILHLSNSDSKPGSPF